MKMTFMEAAFCAHLKGSGNKIVVYVLDRVFNFKLYNNISGPKRN
jgi:hypothetical protein